MPPPTQMQQMPPPQQQQPPPLVVPSTTQQQLPPNIPPPTASSAATVNKHQNTLSNELPGTVEPNPQHDGMFLLKFIFFFFIKFCNNSIELKKLLQSFVLKP